jgi:hypothetical protein
LVLSGVTGQDDPWHDFDGTSGAIAAVLRETGLDVTIRPSGSAADEDFNAADLLVVNCGLGSPTGIDQVAEASLVDLLGSDRPVLGVHASSNAFAALPAWQQRLGVRWVEGRSMHPPIGPISVSVGPGHPIGAGLATIDTFDELYCALDIREPFSVAASHARDGEVHPLSIARDEQGGRRTVFDAFGHGIESYDSPSRCALLRREVDWLLGR